MRFMIEAKDDDLWLRNYTNHLKASEFKNVEKAKNFPVLKSILFVKAKPIQ